MMHNPITICFDEEEIQGLLHELLILREFYTGRNTTIRKWIKQFGNVQELIHHLRKLQEEEK